MASCSSPSPFKFQSTLPQGKWPVQRGRKSYDWRISIHTSAREVTVINITELQKMRISIHTSAREVTLLNNLHDHADKFQSTLPQGKWPSFLYGLFFSLSFQSTLPQGKWLNLCLRVIAIFKFQSTLPQGKWPTSSGLFGFNSRFQSTLPQGKWHCPRHSSIVL